jgi:hypothetical protein
VSPICTTQNYHMLLVTNVMPDNFFLFYFSLKKVTKNQTTTDTMGYLKLNSDYKTHLQSAGMFCKQTVQFMSLAKYLSEVYHSSAVYKECLLKLMNE